MHNPKQPEHFLTIRTLSVYRVRPWETAVLEPILSALSVPWSFLLQISFGDKILTYFLFCLWQQDHLETTYWVLCKKQMETLLQQSWVLCWPCRQMGLVGECGILGCYRTPVQTLFSFGTSYDIRIVSWWSYVTNMQYQEGQAKFPLTDSWELGLFSQVA